MWIIEYFKLLLIIFSLFSGLLLLSVCVVRCYGRVGTDQSQIIAYIMFVAMRFIGGAIVTLIYHIYKGFNLYSYLTKKQDT